MIADNQWKNLELAQDVLQEQNLEAEQSILGGILLENVAINPVLEIMAGSDFYSDAHRKIFAAILELSDRNQPIDLITLSNHLKDKKQLDAVGGAVYLSQLVDNVPSAANIAHYARIVKEKSVLRNLIGTATGILNRTYGAGADVDSVLDEAEHAIFEISQNKIRPSFYPLKEIIKDSFRTIERLYEKKELITGVASAMK